MEASEAENHSSKKRKMGEKIVVTVKIQGSDKKQQKSEGAPSDSWSWRKYGQKPIKGSPYPRGYYRCSTSKGCSAKKQVERCKTDASMLIITYTSAHNHPGPRLSSPKQDLKEEEEEEDSATVSKPEEANPEDHFQYSQSPFNSTTDHIIATQDDDNPFQENLETGTVLYNEDPKPTYHCQQDNPFQEKLETQGAALYPKSVSQDTVDLPPLLKQEENDFYDELEELPMFSFFTALMRRNSFCEERVIVNPS